MASIEEKARMLGSLQAQLAGVAHRCAAARELCEARWALARELDRENTSDDYPIWWSALGSARTWEAMARTAVQLTDQMLSLRLIGDTPRGRVTTTQARLGSSKELWAATHAASSILSTLSERTNKCSARDDARAAALDAAKKYNHAAQLNAEAVELFVRAAFEVSDG